MNTSNNTNISYVFSQETLKLAIEEWVNTKISNAPTKKETFLITKVALPWFMQHLNKTDSSVCMFTHDDMVRELAIWKSKQLADFPQQKKRIDETCKYLEEFFNSDLVLQHKMVVSNPNRHVE